MAESRELDARSELASHREPLRRTFPHAVEGVGLPGIPEEWRPVVARLGLSPRQVELVLRRAGRNGTSFQIELFASAEASESEICREMARQLELPLCEDIDRRRLVMSWRERRTALRTHRGVPYALIREHGGRLVLVLSPARLELRQMRRLLQARPGLSGRLRLATPTALREAVIAADRHRLSAAARDRFHLERPEHSARVVLDAWQGAALGAGLVALVVAFWLNSPATWLAIHVVFSVFFLACVGLRCAAAISAAPPRLSRLPPHDPAELPVYTVLVALHREASILPQLLVALSRIKWPRSKLEIKLVCEADDRETLSALAVLRLHPCVEIVEVPPGIPRTKPKALAYALPLCSGQFVTLYDAEDQPHPEQLLEAWQRFREADDDLAGLQAPLMAVPSQRRLLPRLFAFEYAALFRGLLPWLSARRLILPLGGTSNHFRRGALEAVGAWDPCNVTEDADLGLRLARFGYRCETISRPTLEDAPETLPNWGRQRTRWFKGWMQTWLVHMRGPRRLLADLGAVRFAFAQVLLAGMVVSALAKVVFVGTLVWIAWLYFGSGAIGAYHRALFAIDAANVVVGYAAFLVLGWRTLLPGERADFGRVLCCTPAYWLAMSIAAWRAVWQLHWNPHHWEKTDHPLRRYPRR
jgi:cellulose synthase/poly-beta-1,6-N-acetylglucosamine synthase-like glycosyltransferase